MNLLMTEVKRFCDDAHAKEKTKPLDFVFDRHIGTIILQVVNRNTQALAFCRECVHTSGMKTRDVIDYFGSREKVAEVLGGIDVSAISHWGENVPFLRQYQIEVLSGGDLKARRPSTNLPNSA